MTRILDGLFGFDREETFGEILFYRIFELIMLYWVLLFAWKWGFYIQRIGDVILPLGIANYVDVSFMFIGGISIWNAGLITAFAAIGLFRLWRYAYLVTLLLLHLQYVSRFSLGEISHGANVIGVALLGLALGAIVFAESKPRRRFVLGFCYFFIGLGYVSAATVKLVASGPLWVDGSHLWMWIGERTVDTFSITGSISHNVLQEWILDSRLLGTLLLSFGLLTELFGFMLWFPRWRWIVMTLLISMHVGVLLSMKINFPANDVILLLLAYPWFAGIDRLIKNLDERSIHWLQRLNNRIA